MSIKGAKVGLLVLSVVLVIGVFAGMSVRNVHAMVDTPQNSGAYQQMDVFGEVMRYIQTAYVVDPNMTNVSNGAMRGLLESLDPNSSYLTPTEYAAYKTGKQGNAQIGANVSKRAGYATIVSVIPGSPADRAGLTDGDWIEAIDGHDTRSLPLLVVRRMLSGAPGSEVTLSLIRPRKADPDKVVVSRAIVTDPAVADAMYEGSSILYLKPMVLDKEHVSAVEAKLKSMGRFGNRKVLLDLRDVAAGDPQEAVRLANFFLQSGTITTLEGQKFPKQVFTAEASHDLVPAGVPVVVLVNGGTAGPAEIAAAALQDNKRADLVGEKTFGAGSVQKTFDLPDGAAVILSVAKYESPLGKRLQDDAVTPGTVVAPTLDLSVDDSAAAPARKSTLPDDQLKKAIEMLKAKTA